MKLGVLEAGGPPEGLAGRFARYPVMFGELMGVGFEVVAYDVRAGVLPDRAEECEGWLITGSAAGVYDDLPWIAPLKAFVQEAAGKAPMVGICFGHQLMAEAFGGKVIKSPKGWGVGLHRYAVTRPMPWMDGGEVALPVSHQDQVVELPNGALVVGGSDFAPYGILAYPERRAFTMQPHPEFAPAYAIALLESRRGSRIDAALADSAIASLGKPNDRERAAGWLRRFLTTA